jgi:hypothetical protein
MVNVTGELKSRRVDDSYVDDSDTYATAPETETVEEAVDNLTDHSQMMYTLIALTGQIFAFQKCMWQILFWISVAGEFLMALVTATSTERCGYEIPRVNGTRSSGNQ